MQDERFSGTARLHPATIGADVRKIGKNAYNGCGKLKTIKILSKKLSAKTVGAGAFKGISAKATFKCPKGKAKAYGKMLQKKGAPKTAKFK